MLYLLYGQQEKKNLYKTDKKKEHYRCKAEVFFPQLYFFTLLQKGCIFQFLSNF